MKTKIVSILFAVFAAAAICFAQPMRNGNKPPSVKERLARVNEKICTALSLNSVQKTKVEEAYKEFFLSMDKLMKDGRENHHMPGREKAESLVKARDQKVKAAIPGVLYVKYLELEKSLRPHRPKNGAAPQEKK